MTRFFQSPPPETVQKQLPSTCPSSLLEITTLFPVYMYIHNPVFNLPISKLQQSINDLYFAPYYSNRFHRRSSMAFRATNLVKSMVTRTRGGSVGFASSTSPKMKAFSPAADHHYENQDLKPKRSLKGGAYAPVYISLGLILMSVSIGAFTANHQLKRSPNVFVKKSKRETLPELVEPEKVAEESDEFIKKSLFRKIAHVQEGDRQEVVSNPIHGDTYAARMNQKPYIESLKSVGVEVEKKPFVEPPPLKQY